MAPGNPRRTGEGGVMEIEFQRDFASGDLRVRLYISGGDMESMEHLKPTDNLMLKEFGRADATIEERLMGLQILARMVEEGKPARAR